MSPQALFSAGALAIAAAMPAGAVTTVYTVHLSGASEAPANALPGLGDATVTFDSLANTMQLDLAFSGLVGNVTASHIHCCTAVAGSATAGVATTTPTFPGFPLGVTAGSYSHTFDLLSASSYNPAFVAAHVDVATSYAFLRAGIDAGKAYLNIHTSQVPGGEIRGFLQPIPEPQTYALLLLGLGLMGWTARRRPRS